MKKPNYFKVEFTSRFLLRYHMAAILLAAIGSGLIANKELMDLGVHRIILRYPLSVLVSYLAFVLTMRLWLSFLSRAYSPSSPAIEFDEEPGPESSSKVKEDSASWYDLDEVFDVDALSTLDDPCGCLFMAFAVLIVAIGGGTAIILYDAPIILAEIAFQFFLAAGLIRSARRIDSPNWVGSVIAKTWKPFAIVLVASYIFGVIAEIGCNRPSTILQMIESCGNRPRT